MPPVTPIVKYLLILNVLVFAIVYLPGEMGYENNVAELLAMYYPGGRSFRPFQIVSHFFMHANVSHIVFNMLSLFFLGPIVEARLGGSRFLALYLISALGAAGLHSAQIWYEINSFEQLVAAFNTEPSLANLNAFFKGVPTESLKEDGQLVSQIVGRLQNQLAMDNASPEVIGESTFLMKEYIEYVTNGSRMLGASGAVSGVAAAFAVLFPWQKLQILFIPIGIYAAYLIPAFFAIDLLLGVLKLDFDNIAHFAHIGGALTGAAIAYYFSKTTLPPWMTREDPNA